MTSDEDGVGDQFLCHPRVKSITVDISGKHADCWQGCSQQGTDDVHSPLGSPIQNAISPFATFRVSMGTRQIIGKTTFIKINDLSAMVPNNLSLKVPPFADVHFGMRQGFFYR